ncbi:L-ectoine synthase [Saccharospirillum sp. MSK14-1]|uniref:ectoine synthase n=1 Tax=Saccharospirillum sp. MSK14-1 TaxID=1897632 RepID=UPI000D36023F|nr:ectoine synthase [Saccharospirillum sp. MSK14-1]PTY37658.1 L-ectoine synthase [Saccharospirillum sp. MSK14-1]
MIVRTLDQCTNSERKVSAETWNSVRMSLKDDGMGFSFHITTIYAGTETPIHYKNHLETVYCISGEGSILDKATGTEHDIKPGTIYILDQNDDHILKAKSELQLACAFNPPLNGKETHGPDGAYPLEAETVAD